MADVVVTEEDLRVLRERCYSRAATAETVAAYLAALEERRIRGDEEAAAQRAPHAAPSARRRPGGRPARTIGAVALAAVVAISLPVLQAVLHPAALPVARPGAISASRAVLVAPTAPGRLLATLSRAGSWSSGPLDADGRTVVLSTVCRGDGTYDVRIAGSAPTTFVCDSAVPAVAMVRSEHSLHGFTVTVRATTGQTTPDWSISVGTLPLGSS